MIRPTSLSLRLSIFLLAGQLLCFAGMLIGHHLPDLIGDEQHSRSAWNLLAEVRARTLVVRSLAIGQDGSVAIAPTVELQALVAKHPTLQFAAFAPETGAALTGSSPALAQALSGHGDIMTREMAVFRIKGALNKELIGSYRSEKTPFGPFRIVTYGYTFEWWDLFYHLYRDLIDVLRTSWATIAIAVAIGWFTLRRGLAPIDSAVLQARRIDMSALDQRISCGGIPSEITPLIETINGALARLDAGVARQRRFLANAAHELRTPLTIMNARIESPEKPTFKQDLARDVRRLRNIVEQLLVYARFGGEKDSSNADVDVVGLTQAMVDDHALVAVRNGKSVEFQSEQESMPIQGDRRALESVVGNLIDNALRAEPEGGTVIVRVGPGAAIDVLDHGAGVAESDREAIFEPFWRKSDLTPGAGLGLAIAKEIIEAHRGSIRVEETPGGGATFKMSFPTKS